MTIDQLLKPIDTLANLRRAVRLCRSQRESKEIFRLHKAFAACIERELLERMEQVAESTGQTLSEYDRFQYDGDPRKDFDAICKEMGYDSNATYKKCYSLMCECQIKYLEHAHY